MVDVAREAGVSPGLLYTYAASKEALFHHVLQRELGADGVNRDLPIPSPGPAETETLARRALREVATIPSLSAALETDSPPDITVELANIVGEHYDRVHRYRRFIAVAERSALDWPDMAQRFYTRGRQPFVHRLGSYVAARVASGHLPPVPDPDVAARFVIEAVAWFAMHRYADHDGARMDDVVARTTVVQLATAALIGSQPEKR